MTVHPGQQLLNNIKAFATEEAASLAPRMRNRYDGSESVEADRKAIEVHQIMLGISALCDVIASCPDDKFVLRVVKTLERTTSEHQ